MGAWSNFIILNFIRDTNRIDLTNNALILEISNNAFENNNNTIAYQYIHGDENIYNKDNKRNTCVMIHGMLGQGKNLRTFSRRIVKQYPFFDVLLVDLRGHGKSPSFFPSISIRFSLSKKSSTLFSLC